MASSGELLLSAPSRAIGARLMRKLYLPTALIADELPAGSLEVATCVPRFSTDEERLEAERLEEYVSAIREGDDEGLCKVGTTNHKKQSLVEMDKCFVWLNSWAMLSGFGSYCVVSDTVSARPFRVVRGLSDRRGCFDM